MPLGPQLRSRIPKNTSPYRPCALKYASAMRKPLRRVSYHWGSKRSRVSSVGWVAATNGPNCAVSATSALTNARLGPIGNRGTPRPTARGSRTGSVAAATPPLP